MPSFVVPLLIAASGVQQTPVPAAPVEEITLIGRKLRNWRGKLSAGGGRMRCTTRQSSGDAAIDAIGCTAMTACFPTFEPELRAIRKAPRPERDRRNAEVNRSLTACVAGRHEVLVRDLADRRVAKP